MATSELRGLVAALLAVPFITAATPAQSTSWADAVLGEQLCRLHGTPVIHGRASAAGRRSKCPVGGRGGTDDAGAELVADPAHGGFGNEPGLAGLVQADLLGHPVCVDQVVALTGPRPVSKAAT
ncbi:hypothetical protein [Streptomyces sp. I4(2020)]|uniref:hypothetical protein n=1 Tax=Streptomyces sp. I4(2020) TaxID=2760981 RepID=UPI0018EE7219|nr:hypothetical protein [Streptomyces sp. I4(2020)]MBJ6613860.1 hypothetical protein [Streptomyces sp. I3(2020)]MBJ6628785.1 hypothetical protein [Streptomyces sp. I4(2020)]